MGLIASIYRDARLGDCSNGGISGRVDAVTIINIEGPFKPTDERPAVMLVAGHVPGAVRIVPARRKDDDTGWVEDRPGEGVLGPMMGGTYVATSDARLREAVTKLGSRTDAVPLHDRYETQAEYDALSI